MDFLDRIDHVANLGTFILALLTYFKKQIDKVAGEQQIILGRVDTRKPTAQNLLTCVSIIDARDFFASSSSNQSAGRLPLLPVNL